MGNAKLAEGLGPAPQLVLSSNPRGGGLENAASVNEERAMVRFVCFPCLLSTIEDESAIKIERIENEKKASMRQTHVHGGSSPEVGHDTRTARKSKP